MRIIERGVVKRTKVGKVTNRAEQTKAHAPEALWGLERQCLLAPPSLAHLATVLLSASCTLSLLLMFHRLVIGTESVVPESSITKRERDTKEEAFASSFVIFTGEDFLSLLS